MAMENLGDSVNSAAAVDTASAGASDSDYFA